MKRLPVMLLALCCILAACGSGNKPEPTDSPTEVPTVTQTEAPTETPTEGSSEAPVTNLVSPLPETLDVNNLDNCTVAVQLNAGDTYVDDTGVMRMTVTVYTYDLYDMVDIATLKGGDTILIRDQEVVVEALEQTQNGAVLINGGLDLGGYELHTDEDTVYYEIGYSDVKSWHPVGQTTLQVSADFLFTDSSDLDNGPVTYYPGDFLSEDTVFRFGFTPYDTTITIENGQIIAMERRYVP